MGEVFLAEDLTLGRKVALKLLPASAVPDAVARKRLLREARAAAALEHPNICAVYEIDSDGERDFISMQYVEGMTLAERIGAGPIPISEIVSIAVQVAEALAEAQGRAVVHRDIKPSNIMITSRGQVKVMDFGLAAMILSRAGNEALMDTALTRPGVVVGTAGYMSPEQVRGELLDSRSDLFALGIVIFEMVARRRAFESRSVAESLSAVLTHEPPALSGVRPGTPLELERIVSKALRKKKEERYQTADDLALDLKQLALPATLSGPGQRPRSIDRRAAAVGGAIALVVAVGAVALYKSRSVDASPQPQIRSLAVLPLQNLSAEPSQDYFADGMTEALITELAKIKALRVISRTSISQYKGTRKRLPEIGSELNVDAILEGSVARDAGRVRITAQLIHVASDRHLWAESYDRDLRDVLKLQSEVARTIARQIDIEVSPAELGRLTSASSIDPRANEAYLKGLYFLNRAINEPSSAERRRDDYEKSFQLFREAIDIEPRFAQAWAGLAAAYHWKASGGFPQFYPQAKAAALEAIEIDETNGGAHASLAFTIQQMEWDWSGAEREYRRAIELNPNAGHYGYGMLLSKLGRREEAIAEILEGERLNPLTLPLKVHVAHTYYCARQFEPAIEKYRALLELSLGSDYARVDLGLCYLAQGNYAAAMPELQKAAANSSQEPWAQASLAYGYAVIGESKRALEMVRRLEESDKTEENYVWFGAVYAALRQPDQAMRCLERAYDQHDASLPWVNVDPMFDRLRSDPRFSNLLRRMKLGA